jgi:hypothetical protein
LRVDATAGTELLLDAATTPDVHLLRRLPDLPKGALHISDLGFFDCNYFASLTRQGICWLTRLPVRVHVREDAGDWQELTGWLQALRRRGLSQWEGPLDVGKGTPVSARVVVLRCPPEESARRRRKLRERMRRKGLTAGQRQLTLCDWWLLATNVAEDKLPARAVWEVYRLRWQVEKSQADYPSSRRWVGTRRIGYHRRDGVARVGRVVPATPRGTHRRNRMSDTTRRSAPPRA